MGDFNWSSPDVRGAETRHATKRVVRLDSDLEGIAMRVQGGITATHVHTFVSRVSAGNPGFAVELLDDLDPDRTTTAYFPAVSATVTGWEDESNGTSNLHLKVDDQFTTSDYLRNIAALSAARTRDLLFRGAVSALSGVRVVNVALKASVRLTDATGNSNQVKVRGLLNLGGTTYQAAAVNVRRTPRFQIVEIAEWPINPSTDVPWTLTEINALLETSTASDEFGIRVGGKLAAEGFRISGLWLEVTTCPENRLGFLYSPDPPRSGWVEHNITDAVLAGSTHYWLHVYALRGTAANFVEIPALAHPAVTEAASAAASVGEHRKTYSTRLAAPGGSVASYGVNPGEAIPALLDASGTIDGQSQPYADLALHPFHTGSDAIYGVSRGQEITTAAAETYLAVQVPVGWQNPKVRPSRRLRINVRTGTLTDSGGVLVATAVLDPADSLDGAVVDTLIRFTEPWAAGATTQYRLFFSSEAAANAGWIIPLLDTRSELIGTGTTVAEIEGATQGGQTDSLVINGAAADRYDFPVAIVAAPDAPANFTVTSLDDIPLCAAPANLLEWDPTNLGGSFAAYRIYRRPARAVADPWELVAELAVPDGYDTATVEAQHCAWVDKDAGWSFRTSQWADGWDYTVTVVRADNGLESIWLDAYSERNPIPGADDPWLTSSAAPWLDTPLRSADKITSDPADTLEVYRPAGRDMHVVRGRLELPGRRWAIGWTEGVRVVEDAARRVKAAAAAPRSVAVHTPRGDRLIGRVSPPGFDHAPDLVEADAVITETARSSDVAGHNLPAGLALDGSSDYLTVADHADLDPGDDEFTVVIAARIPSTANKPVISKAEDPTVIATAPLRLRAGSVDPDTYQAGDPWPNLGTLGSSLDATVDTGPNGVDPVLLDAEDPDGPGFQVGAGSSGPEVVGFNIADNAVIDIPNSGGFTITFDITPLDHTDPSYKIAWKYPAASLPLSGEGWVLEHVDDTGGGPGSGGLIAAAHDGTNYAAIIEPTNIAGRQQITIRWDRDTDMLTLFRNGAVLDTYDISTFGDATTTEPLHLGQDVIYHAVLAHSSALTDAQVESLHDTLAGTNGGWVIATDPLGLRLSVVGEHRFVTVVDDDTEWFDDTRVVAADSDGDTIRLLRDGQVIATADGTHGAIVSDHPLVVAGLDGSATRSALAPFHAAALYRRQLTDTEHEAAANYLHGYPGARMPAGAEVFIDLRDDRCWDGISATVTDLTGNKHDATVVGAPPTRGVPWPLGDLERF